MEFAKNKLFTYTKNGQKHMLHDELKLSNQDIQGFLDSLDIDIYAISFEEQEAKVIQEIMNIFGCDIFEAEYYFYNSALRIIKEVAIQQNVDKRTVSKKWFLEQINQREILFDKWYLQLQGEQKYCRDIRKKYFTQNNVSPYARFFLIESDGLVTENELKTLIIKIAAKWSRLSKRETNPFCPYIYFHGISDECLLNVKNLLHKENINLVDGYSYLGADFSVQDITIRASCENGIKVKIINKIDFLSEILANTHEVKEIYIFYLNVPFYEDVENSYVGIQIPSTNSIDMII